MVISSNLKTMDYNNNLDWFKKTYDNLINTRLSRGLDKSKLAGYYEKHHIIPRCMGGLDEDSNYVLLTTKEHILAHLLLARINYDNLKVVSASLAMCISSKFIEQRGNNLRYLSYVREIYGDAQKGKYLSKEHKEKISIANKGRKRNSTPWSNNISSAKKGKAYGTSVKDPNGIIYRTLEECSKVYNVTPETIKYWAVNIPSRGFSLVESSEILSTAKSKKVVGPDGTIHNSISMCSKCTGHDRHTIANWIKNHPEKGYKFID